MIAETTSVPPVPLLALTRDRIVDTLLAAAGVDEVSAAGAAVYLAPMVAAWARVGGA